MGASIIMKKVKTLQRLFVFFLLVSAKLMANPIMIYFFSEIQVNPNDPVDWRIELHCSEPMLLDLTGWSLSSNSDSARIKDGIILQEDGYLIITRDSLLSNLTIDADGDVIHLWEYDSEWMRFEFGDVQYSQISAPGVGQSLSLSNEWGWYIDNSPTLGFPNDLEGGLGTVEGSVYSSAGNTLQGALVIYDIRYHQVGGIGGPGYWDTSGVWTDSLGHYQFNRMALLNNLSVSLEGFYEEDTLIQIWPDSVRLVNFYLTPTVGITTDPKLETPGHFDLKQNYPNPFNPSTTIEFDLPTESSTKLQILRIDGSELVTLVDQKLSAGNYSISWDARNTPSGIYIYSLEAGPFSRTRKMILLK